MQPVVIYLILAMNAADIGTFVKIGVLVKLVLIKNISMAPDKIYVPQNIIEARHIQELGKPVVAGSTEYIRKETILELVKDLKHIYEIPISNHQLSRLCRIKAKTLQIVIEKIESL